MNFTRRLVASSILALFAPLLLALPAHGGEAETVAACHTAKRASGDRVTRVRWESGRTVRRINLTARTRLFPGAREQWSSSWGKADPRIVGCSVLDDGTVLVRTRSRAKYAYVPPAPSAPSTPAPATYGRWQAPVTLSIPGLDPTWQAHEAAAAWNVALPAGLRIAVIEAPCAEGQVGCIPVAVEDVTGLQHEDVEPGRVWRGAASVSAQDGVMQSCRISLSPQVPTTGRPRTMAHELGHCLGLPHWDHEDGRDWSVMSTESTSGVVTSWDLGWLAGVYA